MKGKLVRWNGDKGFGFIRCEENHEEYFVHISAFPRDGVPPRIDESVSFEVRVFQKISFITRKQI